jgi:ribosomal protein S1
MSADWARARSYKETEAIFEGKVEGFNNGGFLIKFYSLIGFLPYTLLNQAPFCKGNLIITLFSLIGSFVRPSLQEISPKHT